MQSAQAMALNELKNIREARSAELERRREELRGISSEYAAIESDLQRAGNNLLRSVLNGGRDFDRIKDYIQAKQREKAALLKGLDLPADYLDEKYNCDICRDTGFDDEGKKCGCLKELTAKFIIVNSNMSEMMKEQTFENFDLSLFSPVPGTGGKAELEIARSAMDKAKNFADNIENGGNVLLKGGIGTGKTYLSSCIANRVLDMGKTVYYETAYKLCELLENIHFEKGDAEYLDHAASVKKYAEDVDLLIIDDLGTEFQTQFTAAALFDLFNTRLMRKKPTVISTNLGLDELNNNYSSRFISRIIGEYTIIPTVSRDLRHKKYK